MKQDFLSCRTLNAKRSKAWNCRSMTQAKIDSKGRISIPSEIRKTLGLNENDILEFAMSIAGKEVVLRKKFGGGLQ